MRFLDFANGSLWAMEEGVLNMFVGAIQAKVDGRDIKDYVLYESKDSEGMALATADAEIVEKPKKVAVIPIDGALSHRSYGMSSGQSYKSIQEDMQSALDDDSVGSILLDIDSPGGTVAGVFDLGGFVREARSIKPVYTYTDGTLASAAYWIASMTDGIIASPTAKVGSIGVYGMHVDYSEKLKNEGIKVSYIKAGKYKTVGNETEPLSKDDKAYLQQMIDSSYATFTEQVADSRGLNIKDSGKWAEGRVFTSTDGKSVGLVDVVGNFQDAVNMAAGARLTSGDKALNTEFMQVGKGTGAKMEGIESRVSTNTTEWSASLASIDGSYGTLGTTEPVVGSENIHKEGQPMPFDPKQFADDPAFSEFVKGMQDAAKEEALSTAQAQAQKEIEAKDSVIETLKTQNSDLDGRVRALEKEQTIQTEKQLKAEADHIFDAKISQTTIPERLHGKVRKQLDHNAHVEDGKLDKASFAEAIDAELKDWEVEEEAEATFLGYGSTGKSVVQAESTEAEDDKALTDMLQFVNTEDSAKAN